MNITNILQYSFFPNSNFAGANATLTDGEEDPCATPISQYYCNRIFIHGFEILSPANVPCCIASLIIGLWTSSIVRRKKLKSYYYYSLAFKFTGIMMTCSTLVNSILISIAKQVLWLFMSLLLVDETLTSAIAVTFFFGALVDLNCIKDKTVWARVFHQILIYTLMGLWIWQLVTNNQALRMILYSVTILVFCGFWVLSQFILILMAQSYKGLKFLILAAVSGFFGLLCINDMTLYKELCELFSCYFSGGFFWFLVTPLCIYFIYKYYLATHQHLGQNAYKSINRSDLTSAPNTMLINQELTSLNTIASPATIRTGVVQYPQPQFMPKLVPIYVPV